jgi:hypothetical protein
MKVSETLPTHRAAVALVILESRPLEQAANVFRKRSIASAYASISSTVVVLLMTGI